MARVEGWCRGCERLSYDRASLLFWGGKKGIGGKEEEVVVVVVLFILVLTSSANLQVRGESKVQVNDCGPVPFTSIHTNHG